MEKTKVCSKCKESKPYSSFNNGLDRYGLQYQCKQCKALRNRMVYVSRKEGKVSKESINEKIKQHEIDINSNSNRLWLEQWKIDNKERIEESFKRLLETIK
jgi:hypothetical protein